MDVGWSSCQIQFSDLCAGREGEARALDASSSADSYIALTARTREEGWVRSIGDCKTTVRQLALRSHYRRVFAAVAAKNFGRSSEQDSLT